MYDSTNSVWLELDGETNPYVSLTITFISGTPIPIIAGQNYIFRVRAKNVYGFGEFSDSLIVKADSSPSTVSGVQT